MFLYSVNYGLSIPQRQSPKVAKMANFFSRCHESLRKSCKLFQAILDLDLLPDWDHVIETTTQLSSRLMECDRSTYAAPTRVS